MQGFTFFFRKPILVIFGCQPDQPGTGTHGVEHIEAFQKRLQLVESLQNPHCIQPIQTYASEDREKCVALPFCPCLYLHR
jgi:hypothetical protein